MHNLKRSWAKFTLRNQNKGIPNLMLYVIAVKVILFFMLLTKQGATLEYYLLYLPEAILHGEVWRLFTFIFLPDSGNVMFFLLSILFYAFAGRALESAMGRFRFTLFFFSNIFLCSIMGMILHACFGMVYAPMELFVDQSLLFALATVNTNAVLLFMFIIPLKIKYLAWIWTFYLVYYLFAMPFPVNLMAPLCLIPYFLFFGRNSKYLLPDALLLRRRKVYRAAPTMPKKESSQKPYHHKCTVCGRTDTDFPNLEFRYCSRCKGFYCYCSDHINDHVHITE